MYIYNMKSGIYCIRNIINNKMYIGYSKDMLKRKSSHFTELKYNYHDNDKLQKAYNKYGKENFEFNIIAYYPDEEFTLPTMEHYWCALFNVHDDRFGYNIAPTDPYNKPKRSNETRKKLSKSLKGKKRTPEQIEKIKQLKKLNPNKFSNSAKIKHKLRQRNLVGVRLYAINLDGIIYKEFNSIPEASEDLNISTLSIQSNINKNISHTNLYKTNNFIFIRKELYDANQNYSYKERKYDSKKVKITNLETGEEYIFDTLLSVYEKLDIYHGTIREGIQKRNGIYKNYKMEYLNESK